jgi:hypothetical protein
LNIYPVEASSVGYISNVHTLYAEGWMSFGCVLRNLLGRFSKYRLFATSLGWFSSLIMFLLHRFFISSSTDLIIRPLRIFSFSMYQRTLTIILRMTDCSASLFAIWLLIAVPQSNFVGSNWLDYRFINEELITHA